MGPAWATARTTVVPAKGLQLDSASLLSVVNYSTSLEVAQFGQLGKLRIRNGFCLWVLLQSAGLSPSRVSCLAAAAQQASDGGESFSADTKYSRLRHRHAPAGA